MMDVLPIPVDVLIVGGGPAGLTAAVYASRAGLSPVILEKMPAPGGQMTSTPEIENVPGIMAVDGNVLGGNMAEQALRLGAKIITKDVTAFDLRPGALRVDAGDTAFSAKAVILAMGARRRRLGIEGEARLAGRGVSWCAVCDGFFFRGKHIAVIGGGNAALDDALYMASLGCKVTLMHRRKEFRGAPFLVERLRKDPNVEILTPYLPVSIEGEMSVTALLARHADTGETVTIPVSAVFICAGMVPNTEMLSDWLDLDSDGCIQAGEDTETGIPGVYAAGDIRRKPLRQIITATADGAVAATRAAEFINRNG